MWTNLEAYECVMKYSMMKIKHFGEEMLPKTLPQIFSLIALSVYFCTVNFFFVTVPCPLALI